MATTNYTKEQLEALGWEFIIEKLDIPINDELYYGCGIDYQMNGDTPTVDIPGYGKIAMAWMGRIWGIDETSTIKMAVKMVSDMQNTIDGASVEPGPDPEPGPEPQPGKYTEYTREQLEALDWAFISEPMEEQQGITWAGGAVLHQNGQYQLVEVPGYGKIGLVQISQILGQSESNIINLGIDIARMTQNILDGTPFPEPEPEPEPEFYFPKEELYQWISPQQMEQFEKMYPDCFQMSYQSALGLIRSQIGELYDIDAILAGDTNAGTKEVFRWMLIVITAYNITAPATKRSQTIDDNFMLACGRLKEMKTGASSMSDAPIKEEPNAWPGVVRNGQKMLG
jgi:hypothetical protein